MADRVSVYHWPDGNRPDEVSGYSRVYGYDEAALTEYISSLRVRQVYAGNYPEEKTRQLYVDYAEVANGEIASLTRVELSDNLLFVNIPVSYTHLLFIGRPAGTPASWRPSGNWNPRWRTARSWSGG